MQTLAAIVCPTRGQVNAQGYSRKFRLAYRRQAAEEGLEAGSGAQGTELWFTCRLTRLPVASTPPRYLHRPQLAKRE